MALSRDEIGNIAKEVADKVVGAARGCKCGIAMWDAQTNSNSLQAVILHERSDWLQPLPQFMESILTIIQQDCGADMSKAKELSKHLQSDIKSENWQEARVDLALLRGAIIGPVQKCAAEEE